MNKETKTGSSKHSAANATPETQNDQSVDDFFTRLQSDMRRPDLSQEAISAAFQAIQKLALDSDSEEAVTATTHEPASASRVCEVCRTANSGSNRFCSGCGAPLQAGEGEIPAVAGQSAAAQAGDHHYHHHYHHHYFSASNSGAPVSSPEARSAGAVSAAPARRAQQPGAPISRAEAAVRKISQDWAQACNTKHLDDLVDLYSSDALVLRANFPPVRGTAAIREFFFTALDAGLGEAEMDPVRVEVFGDVAYEAGRCKTLVPTLAGKRREERGKYLMLFVREPGGDWKTLADCWSSDLSLESGAPAAPRK